MNKTSPLQAANLDKTRAQIHTAVIRRADLGSYSSVFMTVTATPSPEAVYENSKQLSKVSAHSIHLHNEVLFIFIAVAQ